MEQKNLLVIGLIALVIIGAFFIWMRPANAPENGRADQKTDATSPAPSTDSGSSPTPSPTPTPSAKPASTPKPPPAPSLNQGRVVFLLKDEAVDLSTIKSIIMTISRLEIQNDTTKGWIMIINSVKAYDLLRMFNNSEQTVLADLNLSVGSYSQIRIAVDKIIVSIKSGLTAEAVLPSKELKLPMKLVADLRGKSGVTIDIMSDKALHTASDGKFLFLPVVHIDTRSNIETVQIFGERGDFIGGKTDSDSTFGMDETGAWKKDFSFNKYGKFDLENGKIKVISN